MADRSAVEALIGVRYVRGGRDPRIGLDCYGLLIEAYRLQNGAQLPDIATPESIEGICAAVMTRAASPDWVRASEHPGAVILMKVGRSMHVGLQVSDGEFLHAVEGAGVCLERIDDWRKRIVGFYKYQRND